MELLLMLKKNWKAVLVLALQAATKQYVDAGAHVPVGAVIFAPADAAPAGYLKLNGAGLSRVTYASLWAYAQASGNLAASEGAKLLGQFGPGDGVTTFTLPDARGEFVRAWADDKLGVPDSGRAIGSWQVGTMEAHNHVQGFGVNSNHVPRYGKSTGLASSAYSEADMQVGPDTPTSGTLTSTVGGTETRPRNVAWLACIKY